MRQMILLSNILRKTTEFEKYYFSLEISAKLQLVPYKSEIKYWKLIENIVY